MARRLARKKVAILTNGSGAGGELHDRARNLRIAYAIDHGDRHIGVFLSKAAANWFGARVASDEDDAPTCSAHRGARDHEQSAIRRKLFCENSDPPRPRGT